MIPIPSRVEVAPLTLATVLDKLETAELTPTRRRDLQSAVHRVAQLLDRAPDTIPADPAWLRSRLARIEPARHGISVKTWVNLRSNLAAAIEAADPTALIRTAKIALTPAWLALKPALLDQRMRDGLSRFMRFCSAEAIDPTEVRQETLGGFAQAVETRMMARRPREVVGETRLNWNRLIAARPDLELLPLVDMTVRPAPERVSWDALPSCLVDEIERYLAWLAADDPFAENARTKPLNRNTIALRRDVLHAALTSLVKSGRSANSITSLRDVVTPDTFKAILGHRFALAAQRPTDFNRQISGTLVSIAREWIRLPAAEFQALKALASRVKPVQVGMTEKNRKLVQAFDDPDLMRRMIAAVPRLMARAKRMASSARRLAVAQEALALAILLDMPLRMANLSALSFGETLVLPEAKDRPAQIDIPGHAVKNGQPIVLELSAQTTQMLRLYRQIIAPRRRDGDRAWLFVNPDGSRKKQATVALMFGRFARRELGLEMTPHQMRHVAAKMLLDANPGQYETVRQLLGHTSYKVTVNAYAGFDTARAARHHQALLARLRDGQQPPRRGDAS